MTTVKNTRFYTNIAKHGNSMLVRETIDGISSLRKDAWQPTYYLKDQNSTSGLTSLYGDIVKEVNPGDMYESRDWCKTYAGMSGIEVFGQQNEVLQYANQYDFHGWDFSQIKVYSIDIEVSPPPVIPKYDDEYVVRVRKKGIDIET